MISTKVFIPHDDLIWVTGETVLSSEDGTLTISTNASNIFNPSNNCDIHVKLCDDELPTNENNIIKTISLTKFNLPSLPLQNLNIPDEGVEDMTKLNYLHEPAILDNLKRLVY